MAKEVGKDRLVAVRARPVRFVDDDVVEFPWVEIIQMPAQSAHHGENAARGGLGRAAAVDAHSVAGSVLSPIITQRLFR